MSTPLYDELEAKWSEQYYQRAICDTYWPVIHVQTGQTWFEDDEGNEVFPEPQYAAEGGIVTKVDPKLPVKIVNGYIEFDESRIKPKRKFQLFGRNQGTNGTL